VPSAGAASLLPSSTGAVSSFVALSSSAGAPASCAARLVAPDEVGINTNALGDGRRQFEGLAAFAQPFRANVPLANASAVRGKVVIVTRDAPDIPQGQRCSFDEKAKTCLAAGAIGMLIANTTDEIVDLDICVPIACAMISATYATGLKDGDYVIVDDRKIRAEEIDFEVISSQDSFHALGEPFCRRTQRMISSLRSLKSEEFQSVVKVRPAVAL
jgi:hypothetical protein